MIEHKEDHHKTDNNKLVNRQFTLPATILIAALLISGSVLYSTNKIAKNINAGNNPDEQQTAGSSLQPSPTAPKSADINKVKLEGEPFIGDKNAPVTLAYWLDFQCPFCKRFDLQTLPTLVNDYVNSGKLRVVFKDFQFLGPDSQTAGLAAKAIWEMYPDQYFKWHQAMYKKQDGENSGFGKKEDILNLIRNEMPGIDANKISSLMEKKADEYQQEQDADKAEGGQFGIAGTPGFVIGNQQITGAQPTSVFTQMIDSLLN